MWRHDSARTVTEINIMQLELNRLFAFEDILEKYGGPPKVWEILRPYLPVWRCHEGKPIYLESQVDDFLRAVHLRWSMPTDMSSVAPPSEQSVAQEYLTITEVQKRFLGGKRSKEWWYRQAKTGKLPHHRTGKSVLLRAKDVEDFVSELRAADTKDMTPVAATPSSETAPSPPPRPKKPKDTSGFRFFGQ